MRNRKIIISILILILVVVSCAKTQSVKQTETKKITGTVTIELLKKAIVFKNLTSVKSAVSVKILHGDDSKGEFNGVFVYRNPDKTNIRIFGPMGLNAMQMNIAGSSLQIYIPPKNLIYEGTLPFSAGDLSGTEYKYSFEELKDKYILYVLKNSGSSMELLGKYSFEKDTLFNNSARFYYSGKQAIEITYSDFIDEIPRIIKMAFPNGSAMELTMKEPYLNTNIPDDYFKPVDKTGREIKNILEFFSKTK